MTTNVDLHLLLLSITILRCLLPRGILLFGIDTKIT